MADGADAALRGAAAAAAAPHDVAAPIDLPALLADGRARGLPQADPVRWHFVEALARRAAGRPGATGRWLQARLQRELAAFTAAPCPPAAPPAPVPAAGASPLATLLAELARPAPPGPAAATLATHLAGTPDGPGAPAAAPQALAYLRRTWSRLQAEQRLTQSLAKASGQAGPLNSQAVVLRTLTQLRQLSPDYLHRFMQQVDALMWLEQAAAAAPAAPATPVAGSAERPRRRRPAGR